MIKKFLTIGLLLITILAEAQPKYEFGGMKYETMLVFPSYSVYNGKGALVEQVNAPFKIFLNSEGYGAVDMNGVARFFDFNDYYTKHYYYLDDATLLGDEDGSSDLIWFSSKGEISYIYEENGTSFVVNPDSCGAYQKYALMIADLVLLNAYLKNSGSSEYRWGEKQKEPDGYIWYKKYINGKYCARDQFGNFIFMDCDDIYYSPRTEYNGGVRYFEVKKGSYEGAYTVDGKSIISVDEGYSRVKLLNRNAKCAWFVERPNMTGAGVIDTKGNVVIPITNIPNCEFDDYYLQDGHGENPPLYIRCMRKLDNWSNYGYGVYDLNGNCIVEPSESVTGVWVWKSKLELVDSNKKKTPIYKSLSQSTRFCYDPTEDLK